MPIYPSLVTTYRARLHVVIPTDSKFVRCTADVMSKLGGVEWVWRKLVQELQVASLRTSYFVAAHKSHPDPRILPRRFPFFVMLSS